MTSSVESTLHPSHGLFYRADYGYFLPVEVNHDKENRSKIDVKVF